MSEPENNNSKSTPEPNWLHKTLESLESDNWVNANNQSYLIKTCTELRKKPLKDFEIEDLRIMIGQNFSLKYLVPLAIAALQKDILIEGDFYEGDLLKSVLTSDKDYWKTEVENWKIMCDLFQENRRLLETFETTREIRNGWLESFSEFEKIN